MLSARASRRDTLEIAREQLDARSRSCYDGRMSAFMVMTWNFQNLFPVATTAARDGSTTSSTSGGSGTLVVASAGGLLHQLEAGRFQSRHHGAAEVVERR